MNFAASFTKANFAETSSAEENFKEMKARRAEMQKLDL
jgi:hypothetical protein